MLITSHGEYKRLATNKDWVLGSDKFKQAIENKLNRLVAPLPKGGDRKSEKYRESRVLVVDVVYF